MNSTSVTPAIIKYRTRGTSGGRNASRSGRRCEVQPSLVAGYSAASRPAIASRSWRARSIVTPGFSRPNANRPRKLRGSCDTSGSSGTQSRWLLGNAKPGGITPITTWGLPLTRMGCPMMRASPRYRRVQRSWPSSTTLPAPGRSSSALKPRPRIGDVPSIGNRSQDTPAPRYRSGSAPRSAIVRLRPTTAAMVVNVELASFQSRMSRNDRPERPPERSRCSPTTKMRSGSVYGYGLRRTPSMMLKIVAFRPMPNPRQRIATVANALLCQRLRIA